MNSASVVAWFWTALPGVIMVAVLAFPVLFFPSGRFLFRLIGSFFIVMIGLSLFGMFIGHQFEFLRWQDMPVLGMGMALAIALSAGGRALRRKPRSAK